MKRWWDNGAMRVAIVFVGAFLIIAMAFALTWFLPFGRVNYEDALVPSVANVAAAAASVPEPPKHISTPDPLKAVYLTACAAGHEPFRSRTLALFGHTELNAVVIDLKDYTGTISYASTTLQVPGSGRGCRIGDLPQFISTLHEKSVYAIARITVFQDPFYANAHPDIAVHRKSDPEALWRDKNGLAYIDPGAPAYWDYIVDMSKEAYGIGFDEINFDYIRFPSDGDLSDVRYIWSASTTKAASITNFFAYLHGKLSVEGIPMSADLFGLTTSSYDDLGIGQVLENALPYFDYVSPMVYPSHFASGFMGFSEPAAHPYEVIKYSMDFAARRALAASTTPAKLRPWLQDFNLGAYYTPAMVRAEMQATYDAGLTSWMLWNAASLYQVDALAPANMDMANASSSQQVSSSTIPVVH